MQSTLIDDENILIDEKILMMAKLIFYKMFLSRNRGSLQCDGIDNSISKQLVLNTRWHVLPHQAF